MSRLIVVSGPTAVGKGTIMAALKARQIDVWVSVSATTRPARPGEVDGVHYFFVSREEFELMIADGQMLEWATVHGEHLYGTPKAPVESHLAKGTPVILEIDLQGARQVKEVAPNALYVFIAPPTFEDLVLRLESRGTEDAEHRARRLETARVELQAESEFDEIIVNDVLERAVDRLEAIVASTR